jgi:hypothetical protein
MKFNYLIIRFVAIVSLNLRSSCFALLLLAFADASAKNYYVSASGGNAEFNGLSVARPKKSLQQAANLTRPGDTVFVLNGIYRNDCETCDAFSITRSGSKNKYIIYINYPGHQPIISFNGWAGISVKNGASYIKISGFEVIGNNTRITLKRALLQPQSCSNKKGTIDPAYNGNGILVESSKNKRSHHIIIAKNRVHDCGGGGIGISHADYIIVEDNLVYNTSWYTVFGTSGISFYQFWNYDNVAGYHNFIRRNKCYNNKSLVPWIKMCKIYDGNGIIVDDFRNRQNGSKLRPYNSRTLIANNICWFNGGTGIHTFQSDHIDIINNTAYGNSRSKDFNPGQILSGAGDDNKIINNILVAEFSAEINSNYLNTNLVYENNLHYQITNPLATVSITTASCLNGQDPLFVYPANSLKADFRLQSNSPAIRRGQSSAAILSPNLGAYP